MGPEAYLLRYKGFLNLLQTQRDRIPGPGTTSPITASRDSFVMATLVMTLDPPHPPLRQG